MDNTPCLEGIPSSPPTRLENEPADLEAVRRAEAFLSGFYQSYIGYHNHKETMAYAGMALIVTAFAGVLLAEKWPPDWLRVSGPTAIALAVTGVWLLLLLFLTWQLRLRRWASIHVDGAWNLLGRWVSAHPTQADLAPWTPDKCQHLSVPQRRQFFHYLWPMLSDEEATTEENKGYPTALVKEWIRLEKHPNILLHERLLVGGGWVLYALVLIRTLLSS